jgi:hypothetical protein
MSAENAKGSGSAREPDVSEDQALRAFLRKAGWFAVVTPPAITLLLGTSLNSQAIAASSGSAAQRVEAVRVRAWDWGDSNTVTPARLAENSPSTAGL